MKKLLLIACLSCVSIAVPITETGCTSSEVIVTQRSLLAVGQLVDTAMVAATKAYHNGDISADVWGKIAAMHDNQFMPAYQLAVKAATSDLTQPAPADLASFASDLTTLVSTSLLHK